MILNEQNMTKTSTYFDMFYYNGNVIMLVLYFKGDRILHF